MQEELHPLRKLATLPDCLKPVVILALAGLEVRAHAQQRLRQHILLDKEKNNEKTAQTTIAVKERVDRLELVVKQPA